MGGWCADRRAGDCCGFALEADWVYTWTTNPVHFGGGVRAGRDAVGPRSIFGDYGAELKLSEPLGGRAVLSRASWTGEGDADPCGDRAVANPPKGRTRLVRPGTTCSPPGVTERAGPSIYGGPCTAWPWTPHAGS